MNKNEKIVLLILSVLILASGGLVFSLMKTGNINPLNPQSIISISQITFDDASQKWVSALSLNAAGESLRFYKDQTFNYTKPDGTKFTGSADVILAFTPLQPKCNYNLAYKVYPVKTLFGLWTLNEIPYLELQGVGVLSSPYIVRVDKDSQTLETKNFDASLLGASKVSLVNGNVQIDNLGSLSKGMVCPDSTGAVLVPTISNGGITSWNLASASSFDNYKNQLTSLVNNPLSLSQLSTFLSTPSLNKPSAFYGLTSNIGTISQGSTKLIVDFPRGSSPASIIITVDKTFANTIVYSPPKEKPEVSLSFNRQAINQGESATLTVSIKNVGTTAGSFQTLPSTSSGILSFNPQGQDSPSINAGSTGSVNYNVSSIGSGLATVCITVIGKGSGLTAQACSNLTVNATNLPPVPPPQPVAVCGDGTCAGNETYYNCPSDCANPNPQNAICGNGKCEFGEQVTCPSDCYVAPTPQPTPTLTCSFPFVLTQANQPILYGLLGTATTTSCQLDQNLVLLFVAIVIIVPAILVLATRKKEK